MDGENTTDGGLDSAMEELEAGLSSELGTGEEPSAERGAGGSGASPDGGEGNDPTKPAPASMNKAAPADGKAPASGEPAAPSPGAAPKWWTPQAGEYAALPEPARRAIEAQEQAFAQERETFAAHSTVSEGMSKILSPYAQVFKDYGINPFDHIASLLNAHATLSFGTPEQKAALITNLIRESGLDASKLAAGDGKPYDPVVTDLQRRLTDLQRNFGAVVNEVNGQRQRELEGEVLRFAQDPANVYFKDVIDLMITSMQQNPNQTLKECYDRAVLDNPVTKAKEISRLATEEANRLAKEATEKANKARKATQANIRSTGRARSSTDTAGSWEADLPNLLEGIKASRAT